MTATRVTLPSGRVVIDTGKVRIGLRAEPQKPPQPGSHAELFQRLMTTPLPRHWIDTPMVIETRPSLAKRVARLLRWFK